LLLVPGWHGEQNFVLVRKEPPGQTCESLGAVQFEDVGMHAVAPSIPLVLLPKVHELHQLVPTTLEYELTMQG